MPPRSIDTFWFSPPYNLADRFRGGNFTTSKKKVQYDTSQYYKGDGTGLSEEIYQAQQTLILTLASRALKPSGCIFYSHKVRLKGGIAISPRRWLDATGLHVLQELIWNRGGTANGDPRRFRPVYEVIYLLSNRKSVREGTTPEFRLNNRGKEAGGEGLTDVWDVNPKTEGQDRGVIGHPASTPMEIVRRCLSVVQPLGLVCDPYCGTGTTGHVAVTLGGQYLLSDISLSWATHTEERIHALRTMLGK